MTVFFTDNDLALSTRLLDNILLKSQEGARVRLFVNTVSDGATPPDIDLDASMYIEADVALTGMETSINPDDPTEASVTFSIINPTHLFKTQLVDSMWWVPHPFESQGLLLGGFFLYA